MISGKNEEEGEKSIENLSEKIIDLQRKLEEKEADAALAANLGQELLKQVNSLQLELAQYHQQRNNNRQSQIEEEEENEFRITNDSVPAFATPVRNRLGDYGTRRASAFPKPSPSSSSVRKSRRPSAEQRETISRLHERLELMQKRNDELSEIVHEQKSTLQSMQKVNYHNQGRRGGGGDDKVIWELEVKNQQLAEDCNALRLRVEKLNADLKLSKEERKRAQEALYDRELSAAGSGSEYGGSISRRSSRVDLHQHSPSKLFHHHQHPLTSFTSLPSAPSMHDIAVGTELFSFGRTDEQVEEEIKRNQQLVEELAETLRVNQTLNHDLVQVKVELGQYKALLDQSRHTIEQLTAGENQISSISLDESIRRLNEPVEHWIQGLVDSVIMIAMSDIRSTATQQLEVEQYQSCDDQEEEEEVDDDDIKILVADGKLNDGGRLEWKHEDLKLPSHYINSAKNQRATFTKSSRMDLGDLNFARILGGSWVYREVKSKLTSRMSERRRFIWVNPWSCRLYWSKTDPDCGKATAVKSSEIMSWTMDGKYIIVNTLTEGRIIFRGENSIEHASWLKLMKLLRI